MIGAAHPEEEPNGIGGRIFGYKPGWPGEPGINAQGWTNLFINSFGRHTILNLKMGNVGIGTANPASKLAVKGLPVGPGEPVAGMLCITTTGNIFIDTTPATPCQ